jgi:hypothetical protein
MWAGAGLMFAPMGDDPDVAEVLEVDRREIAAMLARDEDAFIGLLASDLVVNNPMKRVGRRADTIAAFRGGVINYASFERRIEYAGKIGDCVATMGEETFMPKPGSPNAGKTVKRRYTDLWRREGGAWKLALRQATIISVT